MIRKVPQQEHRAHPMALWQLLTMVYLMPVNLLAPRHLGCRAQMCEGWSHPIPLHPTGCAEGLGQPQLLTTPELLPRMCPAVAIVTLPVFYLTGGKKASKHLILQPTWEPFKLPIRCLTCNNFSAFKIILKCSFSFLKSQQWSLRKKLA